MSGDSMPDKGIQMPQKTGGMRLDLDVSEILPTFEAQLHRATLARPGSHTEVWEVLTSKVCLAAFYKCADFPSANMMAEMGVTRALLYYADIAIQPSFIPTQIHDERWRTISKITGHLAGRKPHSSSLYAIPGVGTFSDHPRHTLEYLFRDHVNNTLESTSDEKKLLDLFGLSGKKLRSPVTYPCPAEIRDDLGEARLGTKRGRGRPRGSANKTTAEGARKPVQPFAFTAAPILHGPPTAVLNISWRKREHENPGLNEPSTSSTDDSQWGSGRPKRQKLSPSVVLPSSLITPSLPKKAPSGRRKAAKVQRLTSPPRNSVEAQRGEAPALEASNMEPKGATKYTGGARRPRGRPPKAKPGSSPHQTPSDDAHLAQRVEHTSVLDPSHDSMVSTSGSEPKMSSDDSSVQYPIVRLTQECYSPTCSSDSHASDPPLAIRRKYAATAMRVTPHKTDMDVDMSISNPSTSGESQDSRAGGSNTGSN